MHRPNELADDLCTVDDFYRLVADGQKADLIDGVIHMASPDSRHANLLNGFLFTLIDGYVSARKLGGEVFVSRYAFELSEIRAPEPDVAYVGPQRLHLAEENRMLGGPDVAVEIVSRESRTRDYNEKRQFYQEAGVGEYWLVDPVQQRVEFLRLSEGRYDFVPLEQNRIFRSTVIEGFWIDVEWLLAWPLPGSYDCLQQLLSSSD